MVQAPALDLWGLQEVPVLTSVRARSNAPSPRGSGLPTSKTPSVDSSHLAQASVMTPVGLGGHRSTPTSALSPSVWHLQPTSYNHPTLDPPQTHTGLTQILTLSPIPDYALSEPQSPTVGLWSELSWLGQKNGLGSRPPQVLQGDGRHLCSGLSPGQSLRPFGKQGRGRTRHGA